MLEVSINTLNSSGDLTMKHWIFSTSLSNYRVCEKYNVFGVDERYKITAQNHVNPDDLIFFYIKNGNEESGPFKDLYL